jgi:hypothetical protein
MKRAAALLPACLQIAAPDTLTSSRYRQQERSNRPHTFALLPNGLEQIVVIDERTSTCLPRHPQGRHCYSDN